jgi:hypothetical protein
MARRGDDMFVIEEFSDPGDEKQAFETSYTPDKIFVRSQSHAQDGQDDAIRQPIPPAQQSEDDIIQCEDLIHEHLRPIQQVLEACYKQMLTSVDSHFEALGAENRRLRQRLHHFEGDELSSSKHVDDRWPISNKIAALDSKRSLADAHSGNLRGDVMLHSSSVPVPMVMLANRQQPALRLPVDRREMAATPPVGMDALHYQNKDLLQAVSSNGFQAKSKATRFLHTPPRTPDDAWKEDSCSNNAEGSDTDSPARRGAPKKRESIFHWKRQETKGDISGTPMVFADAEGMKAKIRQNIDKESYNVTDYYKQDGICQRVAKSQFFENATLTVIAINAVYIGYSQDHNDSKTISNSDIFFQFADNFFCVFFFSEVLVRYNAFVSYYYLIRDFSFVFDAALSCTMIIETWGMWIVEISMQGAQGNQNLANTSVVKLLRLLRLTRMARMVRLLRAMPELMILVKGMMVAMRSVFFTLCLLLVIIYIFAIGFVQLTEDTGVGKEYFDTMWDAMNTLLLMGTLLENCPSVAFALGDQSPFLQLLFYFFILMASLTVMNMLVGVLVEVVKVVSTVEKEELQVNFVKNRVASMITDLDQNSDGKISKAEFEVLLKNAAATRALHDVGVDVVGLVDYHDYLFADDAELTFGMFMEIVLSLRGSNGATVKDIVDLWKLVLFEMERLQKTIAAMLGKDRFHDTTDSAQWKEMRKSIQHTLRKSCRED